ncbi:hypothetical protein IAG25_15735 [Caballeronia sp. EK]|uniref:hypothetical protein n=1 Tax=Caballeronia sp. EK TaxID=2767469 RepID=UPI0016551C94|nr:hypothetical protein [Caballeronia sp. EK]MBC8638273.1 hypothetical protein [Caballeronia sp. EK]
MRDVTTIPDALLDVIARAIRQHVQSYFTALAARLDALEKSAAREPVVNVTSFPVKDHSEAIESLRRGHEEHGRQIAEDRREFDRLSLSVQASCATLAERLDALGSAVARDAVATMPLPHVTDHSDAIEILRHAQDEHARQINDERRDLDRLQHGIESIREQIKTLEGRETPVPKDGEPGRDAFELDVLPVIDFGRDYPRGTLAQHQGGLWRAHANTHGAHGWACVVDGIASTKVTMDSERSFTMHIERSGGAHETATFALPVMIYRGVFVAGETYKAGDVVTWAGSLWHCNATTDTKPDAGGDAWTLAAKRGRDGKDARMSIVGAAA